MKFLVFGSLNIDKVYTVENLPEKGINVYSNKYEIHVGGKGLNQAVALSKAGADVYMAGMIGEDGKFLCDFLKESGVDTKNIKTVDCPTGHALIIVDKNGQNQMVLFPGSNYEINEKYVDEVLENFDKNDLIILQYEINLNNYIMKKAHEKGMKIAFNPASYNDEIKKLPLELVDYLILNEHEGKGLSDETETENVICKLNSMISSDGAVILTLGEKGSVYYDGKIKVECPAFKVDAVDTTGAGDTFTGYFFKSFLSDNDAEKALRISSAASAIVVTQPGAAETIPEWEKTIEFIK